MPTPCIVSNLLALNLVHCEDETGAHTGMTRQTYKLVSFFTPILKLFILLKKTGEFPKNPYNLLLIIIGKKVIARYEYIY